MQNQSTKDSTSTREHYCFFVVRHVGTSTGRRARHEATRRARHARHVVRHVATLGQGGGQFPPQMDALLPPKRPTCNYFYTLIVHHQCN